MTPAIDGVAVVIPCHDEADRIARCLTSVAVAARHRGLHGVPVTVVVVLDACSDGTGDRAEAVGHGHRRAVRTVIVEADHSNVGRSRSLGADLARRHLAGADPAAVWLATTDADSVVPEDWLAHHLGLRRRGFHAVAGTVRVDHWLGHPPAASSLHEARYRLGGGHHYGHRHVHGANMGVSAAAYTAAGGFAPVATAEDHLLWDALRRTGLPCVATPHAPVITSSRREGRAPDGFAGFLRDLDRPD